MPEPTTGPAHWALLLQRVAEHRDRSAFTELYRSFAGKLKTFLIRRGANDALAEEILQGSLLQVWEKAHQFDPKAGSASTWIYRIVRNRHIDHLRRTKRIDLVEPDELAAPDETGAEDLQLKQRVKAAIEQLPGRQAQITYMSFFQGKTHREIAEELAMPLGSVKSSLRLAFDKLRSSMGDIQ